MAFCTKCGKSLPEGANVCPDCGTPVKTAQPAPKAKKAFAFNDKLINTVTTLFIFVAFAFAAIAIVYGFIDGIVDGAKAGFTVFISTFFSGFRRALDYCLYGVVVMLLQKRFMK